MRTEKIEVFCRLLQQDAMSYNQFADSLVQIGAAYSWRTFFMNDGTYKTL